jgi:hypothetical protein
MRGRARLAVAGALATAAAASAAVAFAGGGGVAPTVQERLSGYQEDPAAISTTGTGTYDAVLDAKADAVTYRLHYSALAGDVTQAHIHLGTRHQSGGIAVFLCSNLGNGPAGTQACPPAPATVTGTIRPADVIGPAAQGLAPGAFAELLDAARAGATYVNVHSTLFPTGEIRAQLRPRVH